jgi:hypothetical protein
VAFGNGHVLAERWNGESWSVQPTSLHASRSIFWHVSCASARLCAATGSLVFGSGTPRALGRSFVGLWNGSRWRFRVRATDPGAVSCALPRFCVLTGGQKPLAWRGSRWRVMPVARKASGEMGPVSCLSATACLAIVFNSPNAEVAGDAATLVRWNGRTWSEVAPIPLGQAYNFLGISNDLSCASMRACITLLAAGEGGAPDSVVFSWDGRSWHAAPSVLYQDLSVGSGTVLGGVACGSPTVCTIVGSNYSGGFIASLAGATVQLQQGAPPPDPSVDGVFLNGVSCVNATCMAVGQSSDQTGTTPQTIAEQYR